MIQDLQCCSRTFIQFLAIPKIKGGQVYLTDSLLFEKVLRKITLKCTKLNCLIFFMIQDKLHRFITKTAITIVKNYWFVHLNKDTK